MTIPENSQNDTEKALSVQLTRSQPGRHRFSKPKKWNRILRPKSWKQVFSARSRSRAVCETNNPQPGGKEQHYRVDQSREVGTGAPHCHGQSLLKPRSLYSAVLECVATRGTVKLL